MCFDMTREHFCFENFYFNLSTYQQNSVAEYYVVDATGCCTLRVHIKKEASAKILRKFVFHIPGAALFYILEPCKQTAEQKKIK